MRGGCNGGEIVVRDYGRSVCGSAAGIAHRATRSGVYGYSTHTANTVFWIATRTVREAEVTSALIVETSSVYGARL